MFTQKTVPFVSLEPALRKVKLSHGNPVSVSKTLRIALCAEKREEMFKLLKGTSTTTEYVA